MSVSKPLADEAWERYFKFRDAERVVKQMLRLLVQVINSGVVDAIKIEEDKVFDYIRKNDDYYTLACMFQHDPIYSWFWNEAEYAEAREIEFSAELKQLLEYDSIYFENESLFK